MTVSDAVRIGLEVADIFERLGVEYLIGGSLASSFHGLPRSTYDADLVANLKRAHVPLLVAALEGSFYIDAERARQAVAQRSSFNVIHNPTAFKIDIFVLKDEPFAREEMRRRQRVVLDEDSGRTVDLASAEDTVLQKLAWYQLGGRVSERQWTDILNVLKVQRGRLDHGYLQRWAERLEVEDLLDEALRKAGIEL